jgi:hypothetical protein
LKRKLSSDGNTPSSSTPSTTIKPSIICHICRGPHYANQCPERKDIKPGQPQQKLQGANQSFSSSSNPWTLKNLAKTIVRQVLLSTDQASNKQQKKGGGKTTNPKKTDA